MNKCSISYAMRARNFDIRLNLICQTREDIIKKLENIKNELSSVKFIYISKTEKGERNESENKPHVHIIIAFNDLIKTEKVVQFLNIKPYEYIGLIKWKNIVDKITTYYNKIETKMNQDDIIGDILLDSNNLFTITEEKRKDRDDTLDLIETRRKLCQTYRYNKLIQTFPEHSKYFTSSAGKTFYTACKQIPKVDIDPNVMENNMLIIDKSGAGKSWTILYILKHILKLRVYEWSCEDEYMSGYDPDEYDVIFIDEMDCNKIQCIGGGIKGGENRLKNMSYGKDFYYRHIYCPHDISPAKPIVITSVYDVQDWFMDVKTGRYFTNAPKEAYQLERRMKKYTVQQLCSKFNICFDPNNPALQHLPEPERYRKREWDELSVNERINKLKDYAKKNNKKVIYTNEEMNIVKEVFNKLKI